MKRPRLRLLVALVGTLTVSLVATTSYAAYRNAMGPRQCCKSNCQHARQPSGDEAERCCSTHLTMLSVAFSKASSEDVTAPAHVVSSVVPGAVVSPVACVHVSPAVEGRAPPGQSLFVQHVALLR
jgi:hypothetical protein